MLNKLNRHTVTGNIQLNYDIVKGLNLMVRGSMDMSYEDRSEQRPMDTQKFKYGMYRTTKIFAQEMQGDFLLKYEKNSLRSSYPLPWEEVRCTTVTGVRTTGPTR